MSGLLYRWGHVCARHRHLIVAIWVVAVVVVVAFARAAGSETSDDLTLPGTGSTTATDLLGARLPAQANGTNPIVIASDSGPLDSGHNRKAVQATVSSLRRQPDVRSAASPLESGSDALSKNKRIAYISVALREGPGDLTKDEAEAVIDAASPASDAGLEVEAGGYLGKEVSKPSTHVSEVIGIAAAVVILSLALGTAVAMSLPIGVAIFGLLGGLSLITLLGHVVEVPSIAPTLGTMLGLGVGIDYALFIVTRYREGLAAGHETSEAVARACASSGSAVVFAGATVVVALLSLVFAGIPIVTALGYSAAIVVTVAILVANSLLPALLAMLGPRVERGRVPHGSEAVHGGGSSRWERWAHGVADHRWLAATGATALLLLLALPVLDMRLGQEDIGQLSESTTARRAYDLLGEGFGVGTNGPLLIAVRFDRPAHNDQAELNQVKAKQRRQQQATEQKIQQQANQQAQALTQQLIGEGVPPDEAQAQATQQAQQQAKQQEAAAQPSPKQQQKLDEQEKFLRSSASDPRLQKLEHRIGNTHDVDSVSPAKVDPRGTAAVFTAIPNTSPSSEATQNLVEHLRDSVIPAATKGQGMNAFVGGTTASYVDLADRITDKLPQVIIVVVALSFVLLMVAFRSIVVPLTAGLMNLISVAAAYGVLTAVFEKGWGASLIGLDHSIPVVSFVPLLMFAILFGLSMDYQVFLLTRINERYARSGDNRTAVVEGLASSAWLITAAALIMVSVFASFILNGDPTVKQFGVGLAVAIAIDASVVRCLLVPAVMEICGRANWWFPRRLDAVLPHLGIDSEEGLPEPAAPPPKPAPAS